MFEPVDLRNIRMVQGCEQLGFALKARETIRNLRVAEVLEQDLDLDDSGGATFRTKLRVSFKYEDEA